MDGLYMKSTDNHTKKKAPVEAFFYRELMSHGRITKPPLGSFLAGQKHTALTYWLWDARLWPHNDKDTIAPLM